MFNCVTFQTTLPYVLELRTAHQVWDSLSNRYNFLTETHVQELKDQLHKLSKTSTIDVKLDYHFIREKILNKQILVQHIGTLAQIADIFTKSLSMDRFLFLKAKLMVIHVRAVEVG